MYAGFTGIQPADSRPVGDVTCEAEGAKPGNTAAFNYAAIQRALTRGGSVSLTRPGTYLVNNTLVISSLTSLFLGQGVVIKLANSTQKNVLVNAAHLTAGRTASSMTSSGQIGTVNLTAHGFAVDQWVIVVGATSGGYNGVFRVLTAAANSFTVRLPYTPSVGTATGTITVRAADTDISIVGPGYFDYNGANNTNPGTPQAHLIIMNGVQQLTLHGFSGINCQKYAVLLGAVADFDVSDLSFRNSISGSDGLHLQGPAFRGNCERFYGTTGDDFVSLTIGDYSGWEVSRGDFFDVTIRGVHADYCAKNLTKYAGNAPFKADRLVFDGIYGTCELTAVNIIDDTVGGALLGTAAGSIVCRNISATHLTANAAVEVRIGGRIDNLLIENVDGTGVGATSAVKLSKAQAGDTTTLGTVKIRNVYNRAAPAGGFSAVGINGLGTAFTIDELDVEMDVRLNTGHGIAFNSDTDLTVVTRLKMSGTAVGPGGGSQSCDGLRQDKGTITNLIIDDFTAFGLRMVFEQATPTAGGIAAFSNICGDGLIRLAEFRAGTLLTLGRGVVTPNPTSAGNAPIRVVNAGTYRIEGDMLASGSTSIDVQSVTNVGTPTLGMKGTLRIDGDEVNGPAAGDMFWNVDAAFGAPGVGLYGRTGAGAWTRLF